MNLARNVCFDPALGLASVFVSHPKRDEFVRPKLDVKMKFGELSLHWRGTDLLSVYEQTLILVLCEIASEQLGPNGQVAAPPGKLETALYDSEEEKRPPVVELATSYAELSRRSGCKSVGGNALSRTKASLQRLCETTIWQSDAKGNTIQSRLLSWHCGDRTKVRVALNFRLAGALLGGQFSKISLKERLSLRTDFAKVLHCFLAATLRSGTNWRFRIDGLSSRLWHGAAECASTMRGRRAETLAALKEINGLEGWQVVDASSDVVVVARSYVDSRVGEKTRSIQSERPFSGEDASHLQQPLAEKFNDDDDLDVIDMSRLFLTTSSTTPA